MASALAERRVAHEEGLSALARRAVELLPSLSHAQAHTLVMSFNRLGVCGQEVAAIAQRAGIRYFATDTVE